MMNTTTGIGRERDANERKMSADGRSFERKSDANHADDSIHTECQTLLNYSGCMHALLNKKHVCTSYVFGLTRSPLIVSVQTKTMMCVV